MKFKSDKKGNRDIAKALTMVTQISVIMISAMCVSLLIGYGLDKFLKTTPLFFIIFIFLGMGGGFRNVYIYVKKLFNDDSVVEDVFVKGTGEGKDD